MGYPAEVRRQVGDFRPLVKAVDYLGHAAMLPAQRITRSLDNRESGGDMEMGS